MSIELSLTVLWLVTVMQTAFMVVLYRQVGLHLLARGEAIARDGPKVGRRVSAALVAEIERHSSSLTLPGEWSSLVIVFVRKNCNVCLALWPELRKFRRTPAGVGIAVMVVFAGDAGAVEEYRAEHSLNYPFVADPTERLFGACRVRVSPFAVAIDSGFTVRRKGLVNNQEHLQYLSGYRSAAVIGSNDAVVRRGANAVELAR